MKKGIICGFICLLTLLACGTSRLESGVKELELGMTKHEVISTLGKSYYIKGAAVTPEGNIETWSYSDPNVLESQSKRIIVNFADGRLVEWYREYIPTPPSPPSKHEHD